MSERRKKPDYEFQTDVLEVTRPKQFKAVGEPTRQRIVRLLTERAATTSQLAEALEQPKGSVGHHLKVLEQAGLIRVVRTRQVRAITEKYYGRTARLFNFMDVEEVVGGDPFMFLREAMGERVSPAEPDTEFSTLRYARIPASRVREFNERVMELADEFTDLVSVPGESVYGFLAAAFLTDLPELPEEEG